MALRNFAHKISFRTRGTCIQDKDRKNQRWFLKTGGNWKKKQTKKQKTKKQNKTKRKWWGKF